MSLTFLLLFIAFYLVLHFWKGTSGKDENSYFIASRKLGLFPLIATLVVSQYGWINGVFEMYLLDGPKAWFVLSLPYLFFNILWVFLGKYFYHKKAFTTPGLFKKYYSTKVGILAALFLTVIFLPIMYIHMGASIFLHIFGIPFTYATLLMLVLASLSIFTGGFKNLVKADTFLFFLTYIGLIVTFVYLTYFNLWDGEEFITSQLQVETVQQPSKYQYLAWWLLALIVFLDPSIHQRLWASNNAKQVSKVMLGAVFFWLLFDLLVIGIISTPKFGSFIFDVYGISEMLPQGISLLFNFMLLAVILSTANTYFNISYNNIAFDILQLKTKDKAITKWSIAILLMAISYFLTVYIFEKTSVIDILFQLFPAAICALFLPFISIFIKPIQLNSQLVIIQMLLSAGICLFFQINPYNWANFATEIPVAIGLFSSLILQTVFKTLWRVQNETKN